MRSTPAASHWRGAHHLNIHFSGGGRQSLWGRNERANHFCLTSTEARLLSRDGGGGGGEEGGRERVKARSQAPTRKTKMPWTATRTTTKMLRQCPLRHCAATSVLRSCCPNCCVEQSHKDNVRSSAAEKRLRQKKSNFQAQLHLPARISSGLTCGSSIPSLLLISPGPAKVSNFFLRVQLTSFLLISPGL